MGTRSDLYRSPYLPWLSPGGQEGDVVVASRVRLARNLSKVPFPSRADIHQLAAVKKTVAASLPAIEQATGRLFEMVDIDEITPAQREALCAKRLISHGLAKEPEQRAAFISDDRSASLLVNEEDHLRILCMAAGMDLEGPLAAAFRVDDAIGLRLDMAFDEQLGYLSSWPSDLGTGLRASVLMHLPGLALTDNIAAIMGISRQIGLNVQPVLAKGSESAANLYRVSNQATLGLPEEEIIGNLQSSVLEIAVHERRARDALAAHQGVQLEDLVWRSYGILSCARRMRSSETLSLMSKLRLGIDLGLIGCVSAGFFSELLVTCSTGYLKNLAGDPELPKEEVCRMRANMVHEALVRHATPKRGRS